MFYLIMNDDEIMLLRVNLKHRRLYVIIHLVLSLYQIAMFFELLLAVCIISAYIFHLFLIKIKRNRVFCVAVV